MPKILNILAVDPAMRNFGMAHFMLPMDTLELDLINLRLVQTENEKGKQVRQNSDDLRRAVQLHKAFQDEVKGCDFVFAEIPSGAQSARASYGFGMQVGILASCPVPLIQVMPAETKRATGLGKSPTKAQIIAWASALYPDANWLRARGKTTGNLVADNEHLADACAIAHAGVLTDEFRRMTVIMRAVA